MTAEELFAAILDASPEEREERAAELLAEYREDDKPLIEASVADFLASRQEPAEFNF